MLFSFYSILGLAFVLGACIGSFLNVCIYRIPAGESIVSPPSRCPKCEARIRWYQNIPLLSWIFLAGKCAACQSNISVRYPLIEALTGWLFLAVVYYFGLAWESLIFWVFVSLLVIVTFIDLDHQIIPDVISLPGIVLGFVGSFLIPWVTWTDSIFGILLGGGSLFLVAAGYELLTKKEGMGGGDIKLLAMLGAFLGWTAVLPIVFIGSLLGTLVGVPLVLVKGDAGRLRLPFGPFLSAAAVIWLFWGKNLSSWYFALWH